jgi:carboxyl-terminal processing protease
MTHTPSQQHTSPPIFLGRGYLRTVVRLGLLVVVMIALALADREGEATPKKPSARDRQVAIAVTSFLSKDHLSHRMLDDQISQRWIDSFLESLDPRKLYFRQSDIDHFSKMKNSLDDLVKKGNISFAHEVYQRYLERLEEHSALISELIDQEHDFTVDESIDTDFDKRNYPLNSEDAHESWRKRIKYDLLLQKAADVELAEAREKLHRRYRTFAQNRRQMDGEELLEIYLIALTTAYDPHTLYMSPSTLENFTISMRLQLEGIGAALQMLDGHTVISKLIPGGAADKDGQLKPEDHIIGVGQGENGEIEDVVGMRLNDVVKKIRGKKDTVVRLQVIPLGKGEPKIYNITRAQIELKDSEARSEIIETGKKANGQAYKVGVIDLPSFYMDMDAARLGQPDYKSTTRDVRKLLDNFRSDGVDLVMIDLRRNGGGSLTEAINLTGLFIDQGPIVQVKDALKNVQHYDDPEAGVSWNRPLVVLTSKFSASASEIFAGAIQDYRRGLVVGDHATHGKGTVQTLMNVGRQLFRVPNAPKLGALKITMQQFYRPSGDSTQNRGVVSDIELPSITTHLDVGESDLEYAVAFDQVDAIPFQKLQLIDDPMLSQIRNRSKARRETSEDFQKVNKRIAKYQEQKERKSLSLQEEVFMAEREDLEGEEEALKDALEDNDTDDDHVVKRDYYFDEALAIALDYVQLLQTGQIAATDNNPQESLELAPQP